MNENNDNGEGLVWSMAFVLGIYFVAASYKYGYSSLFWIGGALLSLFIAMTFLIIYKDYKRKNQKADTKRNQKGQTRLK